MLANVRVSVTQIYTIHHLKKKESAILRQIISTKRNGVIYLTQRFGVCPEVS